MWYSMILSPHERREGGKSINVWLAHAHDHQGKVHERVNQLLLVTSWQWVRERRWTSEMVRSQCVNMCVHEYLYENVTVTVCMYYECICVCVSLCVCTCGGQRSTSSAVPREPLTLILRLSLSLAVSFRLAGWPACPRVPPVITSLSSVEITSAQHYTRFLCALWRWNVGSLCSHCK